MRWIIPTVLLLGAFARVARADDGQNDRRLYEKVRPAIVAITCENSQGGFYGTGTVIHGEGYILTSTLVVPRGARAIVVRTVTGQSHPAAVVKVAERNELTLLKIAVKDHAYAPLGDSDAVRLADPAFTIGNAFQITEIEGQAALCAGIISGRYNLARNDDTQSRYAGEVIETTAALNPGVDGGPLLNAQGEVIGLLSLAHAKTQMLGVAIPINQIRAELDGKSTDEAFGFSVQADAQQRLVISGVVEGSAAAREKVAIGDAITSVEGAPSQGIQAWLDRVANVKPGDKLRLGLSRGPWEKELTLTAGAGKRIDVSWPKLAAPAPTPLLDALARTTREALARVEASVVTVAATRIPTRGKAETTLGVSGLIATADGFIWTSHAAVNGAKGLRVTLADGRSFPASVKGVSPEMDLALLKVEATGLVVPTFGKPVDVRPGTLCAVIGRGMGKVTVTTGVISAIGRQRGSCYQVDAIMNYGNVGGAVVNMRGEVIGVACYVGENPRWAWGLSSGVGFAATTRKVLEILDDLKQGKAVNAMPLLGIRPEGITLVLAAVEKGSPAELAGLRIGDRILSINGKALKGWGDLVKIIRTSAHGDVLKIALERQGERGTEHLEVEAKL